jgi:hypothetical protein
MAAAAVVGEAVSERKRFEALIEKVVPVAQAADAIACRIVGKVRTVALVGSLAACWLAYACVSTFELGLAAAVTLLVTLLIPSLILWKIHGTLRGAVGLPQRVTATSEQLFGKFAEYRQLYVERQSATTASKTKPRFKQLWGTARELYELKSLGNEGRELWGALAGALVMANPLFAIVLFVAMTICLLMAGIAAFVGLAFLL